MADTLLHLTLARGLLNSTTLPLEVRRLIDPAREDFLLGAAFIDLPYYENLLLNALRVVAGRPVIYDPIGNRFHDEHAHALHCAFTDLAVTRAEKAMVIGMWTHYAADTVFHLEIEKRLRNQNADDRITHRSFEAQIGLHCHYEVLGLSGEGDRYAARTLALSPQRSWIPFAKRAVHGALNIDLAPSSLARWLTSLHLYGVLHSRRFPWVTWLPKDDPALLQTSVALYEKALRLSEDYVCLAFQRMNGFMSAADFAAMIPACRLSDGTILEKSRG